MKLTKIITNIGEIGVCNDEELMLLLPNFPKLLGNEFIFTVKWIDLITQIKSFNDIEYFIKGLHIVEQKFREITKNEFGFGSPSSTHRLLTNLEKKEHDLSQRIKKWIRDNGGNYYIK
jgi:hypothetical protein